MIKDKRILITGNAGSIGSELTRQLVKDNKVFGIDINESGFFDIQQETGCFGRVGDVKDKATVFDIFSDFKPEVVIVAHAYKHVPLMEKYPIEAIQTNIIATWNVISEAKRWECLEKFVFISSDKAVSSQSIMGATKRMGEMLTKNQGKGFCAVRFGNVLSSRGSLINIWEKQIKQGKNITVTDKKMQRYFMTIQEACQLVIEAAEDSTGGEIYVLDMGKPINIHKLAEKLVKDMQVDNKIEIIGIRDGETLNEGLMFEEESRRAIKKSKFFIIK